MKVLFDIYDQPDEVVSETKEPLLKFLYAIEKVLFHGLKTGFFGPSTPWEFLKQIEKCLPGSKHMIPLCVQYGKTSLGMFRLWIRVALNDAALGQYLNALIWNKQLVTKYYTPQSLLFSEQMHLMLPVLETLTTIHFKLAVAAPGLESSDYWQKVTWEPVVKV